MLMEEASVEALTEGEQKAGKVRNAGGMKLVYKRLKELTSDTIAEGEADLEEQKKNRKACASQKAVSDGLIKDASGSIQQAIDQTKEDLITIVDNEQNWETAIAEQVKVHAEFQAIFPQRRTIADETAVRVDERNKALDVITKATFVVCEKFIRFKNTVQCKRIKAEPDVVEPKTPPFNITEAIKKSMARDKETTAAYEASKAAAWADLAEADKKKEGSDDPEGKGRRSEVTKMQATRQKPMLAEGVSMEDSALTSEEEQGLTELKKVTAGAIPGRDPRTGVPLGQLLIALKKGKTRKAFNLVQILLDVKEQIHAEQLSDKMSLMKTLNGYYKKSWDLQARLKRSKEYQDRLTGDTATRRARIAKLLKEKDENMNMIKNQRRMVVAEEGRCEALESAYGERDAIRQEDIQNVAKLVSLLRSLYEKKYPTDCLKGLFPDASGKAPLCSGEKMGWCVYKAPTGSGQRCSCWPGYYGPKCQYTLCNGFGPLGYESHQAGACSGHGKCDRMQGKCTTCEANYFHGPKKACEYRHCPASGLKNKVVDDKCSGHGKCDLNRGTCDCQVGFSGEACAHQKCPGPGGVLYRYDSPSACSGRGACNDKNGKCDCEHPYFGKDCNQRTCPGDCLGRGKCDEVSGKCFCKSPFTGPRCEFQICPANCVSQEQGWCNMLTGKCLCKYGHGGRACRKVTHCKAIQRKELNWYTLWDKPGWALCPSGQSLNGLYRSKCNTLSCVNSARCSGVCETQTRKTQLDEQLEVRHCYHSLSWYGTFDKQGWSMCEPNYFVSGLYRDGDSLYNLQMAKCCSFKDSRWVNCEEVSFGFKFAGKGWVDAPKGKWYTGFYRGKGQGLGDIQKAKACTIARGF
jgi:hypothetical protein